MYVLKELWRGNIAPVERSVRSGSDYKKISLEACEQMDRFLENLTPEEKKQLEDIYGMRGDMSLLAEEDAFISGFRLGARIIMEVVGEYKGQFTGMAQKKAFDMTIPRKKPPEWVVFFVVRMTGLEPARLSQRNLNPPSLPIPPHPHILLYLCFLHGEVPEVERCA